MTVVGVSLKAYLGYLETIDWVTRVGESMRAHPSDVEVFVLPSYPMLAQVRQILAPTSVGVGAQDIAADDSGAQTGEVTGALLAEIGCRYVAVGHAERRDRHGETDAIVQAKTAAALRHGLTPVLCVGEQGRGAPADAVTECTRQVLTALGPTGDATQVIVAYEPVWAIGQTRPAPDGHVVDVVTGLRRATGASTIIYGGSAQPGLLSRLGPTVDGLFLGRFAHDPHALATVLEETRGRTVDLEGASR